MPASGPDGVVDKIDQFRQADHAADTIGIHKSSPGAVRRGVTNLGNGGKIDSSSGQGVNLNGCGMPRPHINVSEAGQIQDAPRTTRAKCGSDIV